MYTPILNKDRKKSSISNLQTTFNRHRRKIDKLRLQLEDLENACEGALSEYHSDLKPLRKKTGDLITQFILTIMDLTQDPKSLIKKERATLQMIVDDSLSTIFTFIPHNEIPENIKSLYKEFKGISNEEKFHEEMSELKEMMEKEFGIKDIDTSDINPNDNIQDILSKFAQSVRDSCEKNESPPPPKEKSKKELLKEQKALELEALQNKGISSIYKRLAKSFHPDLEQDPKKRIEKDKLMKRLTKAYENQDLLTMLALESEWLGNFDSSLNDETLKVYNTLLKDQIEDLEMELQCVHLRPRYIEIFSYIQDFPLMPKEGMSQAFEEFDSFIKKYTSRIDDLSGNSPLKSLKKILASLENFSDDEGLLNFEDLLCNIDEFVLSDNLKKARKKARV